MGKNPKTIFQEVILALIPPISPPFQDPVPYSPTLLISFLYFGKIVGARINGRIFWQKAVYSASRALKRIRYPSVLKISCRVSLPKHLCLFRLIMTNKAPPCKRRAIKKNYFSRTWGSNDSLPLERNKERCSIGYETTLLKKKLPCYLPSESGFFPGVSDFFSGLFGFFATAVSFS